MQVTILYQQLIKPSISNLFQLILSDSRFLFKISLLVGLTDNLLELRYRLQNILFNILTVKVHGQQPSNLICLHQLALHIFFSSIESILQINIAYITFVFLELFIYSEKHQYTVSNDFLTCIYFNISYFIQSCKRVCYQIISSLEVLNPLSISGRKQYIQENKIFIFDINYITNLINFMEGQKKQNTETASSQNRQHQVQVRPTRQVRVPVKQTPRYKLLLDYQRYFNLNLQRKIASSAFNVFSVIDAEDEDRIKLSTILKQTFSLAKSWEDISLQKLDFSVKINRGIACLLGLAICDAFGASTQFIPFEKQRRHLIQFDFQDIRKQIKKRVLDPRSGRIGIWTDDCSMALCMADSLLLNNYKFDAKHMRYMFHMWLQHGLDNGGRNHSIGLGGNISISMSQFQKKQQQYTAEGDKFNNGNGSLMRLAPVPLCFVDDEQKAMQFSAKQSRTTHNGDQAKQCSKLLSLILTRLINRSQQNNWKAVIDQACLDFVNNIKTIETVECLALSKVQPIQLYQKQLQAYQGKFKKFNKSPEQDRNWDWKNQKFTYSKFRTHDQPGYVGSYCMDALSMALHTVWFSKSFQDIALVNANMGGDCDTVGAIAGQLGGAIYGIDKYMLHLYRQMQDCKQGRFQVFIKGYKLMTHNPI